MQNSNLSSKIFPNSKESWALFISKVEKDLQNMMITYNNDKRRIKDLSRIINKIEEISNLSKDNIEEILNYKELFMYIDNSLESSFDALKFFKDQGNFDNDAVKTIYGRIVNSPKIMRLSSEYSSLTIKIQFDKERIKRLGELIRGSKIDYSLIEELVEKYDFLDNIKKDILLYPLVMLSIKQHDNKVSDKKEEIKKQEEYYHDKFNELCNKYQEIKNNYKDLLMKCFKVREGISRQELDMYKVFINNPEESDEYQFVDDIKFKIYTLSFFKTKKDIENFIEGISDLRLEETNIEDELLFFEEMINEFVLSANRLNSLIKEEKEEIDSLGNNIFFALDAFNRLIIDNELLGGNNRSNIKALLQKITEVNNSKIEGVKTNHVLGVTEEERLLGRKISMVITSKIRLAYIMVGKSILIIGGTNNSNEKFDHLVKLAVNKNIIPIKKQISYIEDNNLDYINMQNTIIQSIIGEEKKEKTM